MGYLNIAFFWHMHQPYYRDPLNGEYSLPWVRLHALRGYYDMISLLGDYPHIRQTFNLVPSLLRQLQDYTQGGAQDVFLRHTRKRAEELSREEKIFILRNFFTCHWETMVKPYPGYWALLQKRGSKVAENRWEDVGNYFTSQEIRDLQVWFNLVWMGFQSRRKRKAVAELFQKGRFFSEADKAELLKAQSEILQEIIPLYQTAQSRGQVEITTSPFYHPILPILIDSTHASRAMPWATLPSPFSYPEDAESQVQKAAVLYRDLFGMNPKGMWPPEGSVSPELIPIIQRAGISWIASDEGILFKSLPEQAPHFCLYEPYRVRHKGAEVTMVFRDRNLSDLIGFTYAKNTPHSAAEDFLSHLNNIQRQAGGAQKDALVLVALDGENPWEYYPDGGQDFLRLLYEKILYHSAWRTVKISEFLETHPPQKTLERLHSGSWIGQNFKIWIGSPEDNQAWDCLRKTRTFLLNALEKNPSLPPEKQQLAWEEVYIAEGSDWFWWYGDDFHSYHDEEFDRLFRLHLSNVHRLLGAEVPDYLKIPIALPQEVKPTIEPVGLISPVIDGRITYFYEWQDAGYFAAKYSWGSMYRAEEFASSIYYGFDLEHLYFRIDYLLPGHYPPELQFRLHFLSPQEWQVVFPAVFPRGEEHFFLLSPRLKSSDLTSKRLNSICAGQIIELSIPNAELHFGPNDQVRFFLCLGKEELEIERYPRSGYLSMIIPDRDFENSQWQV